MKKEKGYLQESADKHLAQFDFVCSLLFGKKANLCNLRQALQGDYSEHIQRQELNQNNPCLSNYLVKNFIPPIIRAEFQNNENQARGLEEEHKRERDFGNIRDKDCEESRAFHYFRPCYDERLLDLFLYTSSGEQCMVCIFR